LATKKKPKTRKKVTRTKSKRRLTVKQEMCAKYKISAKMYDILMLIPGYNPFKDAEDFRFNEQAAQHAIDFFHERLTHVKGQQARDPFHLEKWQQAIIANLFGWKTKERKPRRRYRESFILVPRKNGKSLLAAGICNYGLFCDGEQGAEIYSAAAKREQAALVWSMAKRQIENSPELKEVAKLYQHSITIEEIGSYYKPISSEAKTAHGFNTHMAVVDELHAQPDDELVNVIMTSMASRTQPLMVYITTADYDRKSVCNEKYEWAKGVRDGTIPDSSFLPVIYEAAKDDDWTNPKVWAKANPNLDISISQEYLERECKRAMASPAYENTFKRLHLNIQTEQSTRWIQLDAWRKCGGEIDPEDYKGKPCWCGLDLASRTDLAAFALYFPHDHALFLKFWIPKENTNKLERRNWNSYSTWSRQGHIKMTEGNIIDYDVIRADILALREIYDIQEIAYDRWNATQITTQLAGEEIEMVEFGQGFASMSAPSKEFEKLIIGELLKHGDNPVLEWMASNVTVELDAAGNMKPSRKKSTNKIDGIVAGIMGIGRAMVAAIDQASVYEDEETSLFL